MNDLQIHQSPSVPVMYWKRFGELVGLDEGVIRGMCDRGHLPCLVIGKHRFINLVQLAKQCAEQSNEVVS